MLLNIPFRARSRGIYVLAIKQSCTINLMTYSSTPGVVEFEIDGGLLHATNSFNSPLDRLHFRMKFPDDCYFYLRTLGYFQKQRNFQYPSARANTKGLLLSRLIISKKESNCESVAKVNPGYTIDRRVSHRFTTTSLSTFHFCKPGATGVTSISPRESSDNAFIWQEAAILSGSLSILSSIVCKISKHRRVEVSWNPLVCFSLSRHRTKRSQTFSNVLKRSQTRENSVSRAREGLLPLISRRKDER